MEVTPELIEDVPPPSEPPDAKELLATLQKYQRVYDVGLFLELFFRKFGGVSAYVDELVKTFRNAKEGSTARERINALLVRAMQYVQAQQEALKEPVTQMETADLQRELDASWGRLVCPKCSFKFSASMRTS